MPLSYLVSTAGHSQSQNDRCPHDIRSIIQLIDQGADELGDEKVVGFVSLSDADRWVCDRYCEYAAMWSFRDHDAVQPSQSCYHSRLSS